MKNKNYITFGILFVCAVFITACNDMMEPIDFQEPVENGYGKIAVNLRENEGRTVLPSNVFDKYVYTFTKTGETTGVERTPDNDGFFTLEIGNYTVAVRAYIGNAEPYTLAANGISSQFSVGTGSNNPVAVRLSKVAAGAEGKFSYTITYPVGAAAEITLQKWPGMTNVTLNPVAQGNGKTQTLQLETGSYMLTVLISKDELYAGISEAVHIYPSVTTTYTKNFGDNDLLAFVPITSAEIVVTAPVKNATPNTTASGAGNFTIGAVSWLPVNNPFFGNTIYTATVTLTANNRHTFTGLGLATINGQNAAVSNNNGSTITLSYTFTETDDRTVTGFTIKTQPTALNYTHGDPLDLTGLVVTITYDDTSTEDVAAADFTARHITAIPSHGNRLVRSTHNSQPVRIIYGDFMPLTTGNITINRAAGAAVNTPSVNGTSSNSITINAVTTPTNGQTVEYAINTVNSAPSTGWQDNTTFSGLLPFTTYSIFARSKENDNYNAGTAISAYIITTTNNFTVSNEAEWNTAVNNINAGGNDKDYTITIVDNFSLSGSITNTFNPSNLTVIIQGDKTISLSSIGSVLRTGNGQHIILHNIQLKGLDTNTTSLVWNNGGTFTMQGSASVHGNTAGGVSIRDSGTFIMQDSASVYGNTASDGGGGVCGGGTFTMQDSASVHGNTASYGGGVSGINGTFFIMQDSASVHGNSSRDYGGGVYMGSSDTFIMQDSASVHGNTASYIGGGIYTRGTFTMQDSASVHGNTTSSYNGGGIYTSGTFTMQDSASIHGNTAGSGGGVSIGDSGTFIMQDSASVYGNTADRGDGGGGVSITWGGGTFIMQDSASVHGNTASYIGGGVSIRYGTFTMQDNASVHGNTADRGEGGGIFIEEDGTFTMQDSASVHGNTASYGGGVSISWNSDTFRISGGTVFGNDDSDINKRNLSPNGAALLIYNNYNATAEYGTFSGETWNKNGDLNSTNNTIRVVNGILQ